MIAAIPPQPVGRRLLQGSKKRRWRIVGIVMLVFAAVALAYYGYQRINGPVAGTVIENQPTAIDERPSTGVLRHLDTTYFKANYAAAYSMQNGDLDSTMSLEPWRLVAHQGALASESQSINLMIEHLPTGGVTESSPYKLYSSRPAQYQLQSAIYGGEAVWEAINTETGYRRVVLWPHGNYLLTVSQAAGQRTDEVDSDLRTILESLRWKI